METMVTDENRPQRQHFRYDDIVALVKEGSSVLDLGCGDGELLLKLTQKKNVQGRGVEIEERHIRECISKGLSVFQGNLDEGLKDYGTASYDYVILNQTLQVIRDPVQLIREMLRVGRIVIVSFPNFAYWSNRLQLLLGGRMPVTRTLPYEWYNTPNIHLFTRRDFTDLCRTLRIKILQEISLIGSRIIRGPLLNIRATEMCYLLEGQAMNLDEQY
jgi:methionine biosynthesis protein MetW